LLNSRADRDLETICLKCLEKQPARRYGSAEALARELERWLRGEPIHARPANAIERVVKWARRNPAVAALAIIAPMFCMLLVLGGLVRLASYRFARAEQPIRIRSALETDSFAARHVASTILLQLELLGKDVQRLSDDPDLIRGLSRNDSAALQRLMDKARGAQAASTDTPFASWYILNARGDILALAPHNRDIVGKNFRGRDYFQGGLRAHRAKGRTSAYISRVFLAENDNLYKFGISVPVRGRDAADAPLLGVLVATVTTDTTVGQANLQDPRRKAVLVGPLDSNPAHQDPGEDANPATYVILLHPSYHRGDEAVAFPHDKLRFIKQPEVRQAGDDDYADPVASLDSAYGGRWLAGFAPVGNTEFMVIIQERFDEAIERTVISFGELALWAVAGVAVLIMLLGGGAWVLWGRFATQPRTGPLGAAQR
jgi:hypothetical protein